jgi:hypothetical protein
MHSHQGQYILYYINHQSINPLTSINQTIGINDNMIQQANGGSLKCGGRCENVCLQIGNYNLKYHMFSIDMGICDIVLGVEWLRTLGPILMDFKELTMQFQQNVQRYQFQGLIVGSPKIISSHCMENILKKEHSDIIS